MTWEEVDSIATWIKTATAAQEAVVTQADAKVIGDKSLNTFFVNLKEWFTFRRIKVHRRNFYRNVADLSTSPNAGPVFAVLFFFFGQLPIGLWFLSSLPWGYLFR